MFYFRSFVGKYAGKTDHFLSDAAKQYSTGEQGNQQQRNTGFWFWYQYKESLCIYRSKQFVKIETNKPDKRLAGAVFLIKTKQEITSSKQPTDTSGQRTNQMRFT